MAEHRLPISLAAPDDRLAEILSEAIVKGGGDLVPQGPQTRALVWGRFHNAQALADALPQMPALEWVQLPSAGVDDYAAARVLDPAYQWTSAKGAYAAPVAEHALALTLALLRHLQTRARATSWGGQLGKSLSGRHVAIVGAGGIAQEFMRLTAPFDVRTTLVRRSPEPVAGADRTVGLDALMDVLPDVDVLLLASPLTEETRGMIGAAQLAALPEDAVLVNVGRGRLVRTDELVEALKNGAIAGAAMDVTDPEPLPDGHALWSEPRALITPHSADTPEMILPLLAQRISENVRRFAAGEPLLGVVEPSLGY